MEIATYRQTQPRIGENRKKQEFFPDGAKNVWLGAEKCAA